MSNYVEILKTFPMLANIKEEELEFISSITALKEFVEKSDIITEGDDGDSMFLLIDGIVDVVRKTPFGDEYVCATLSSEYHCVFGEMALIDKDKRSATIKAKTNCKALEIKASDFKEFCVKYPNAGCDMLRFIAINMARNLRKENENLKLVYQALIEEIEQI